jgi:hypothetical protein
MQLAGIDLATRSRKRFGLPVGVDDDGNARRIAPPFGRYNRVEPASEPGL